MHHFTSREKVISEIFLSSLQIEFISILLP
jgi:hypothetical protein